MLAAPEVGGPRQERSQATGAPEGAISVEWHRLARGTVTAGGRERDLIERARNGEREAFSVLWEEARGELVLYISARVGEHLRSRVDPEEVLQDTSARAWESVRLLRFSGDGTFIRWLKGIARHVILKGLESRRHEALYLAEEPASGELSPSRALRREERFGRLQEAVDRLPADYRQVVLLVRIQGLPVKEAAARLGRTPKSVAHLLSRALVKLRAFLDDTQTLGLPPRQLEERKGDGDR